MAFIEIQPWNWWFSGSGGRLPDIKTDVYYKGLWADEWIYAPYWEPVSAVDTAAPAIGSATFRLRYGKGTWEDLTEMLNTGPKSLAYLYVQIRVRRNIGEVIIWTGVIPAQSFKLLGSRERNGETVRTSDQTLRAHSLDWLLETRLDGAWVEPVGGGAPKWLGWMPAFNQRHKHGGNIVGNRSTDMVECEPGKGSTYIFAKDGETWDNWAIILYLLKHYQKNNGPVFDLGGTDEILDAMGKMSGIYDFNSMTLRGALNVLMNRSRGFTWTYKMGTRINEEEEEVEHITIEPLSLLDEPISFGDVTMPASSQKISVAMWEDPAINVNISEDISRTFDELVIRGARMKSCCSLRYEDGLLEAGWSAAEETAYKDAAKNTEGYGELEDDEKKKFNDKFRSADRFDRVFAAFRAPRDWDWLATDLSKDPPQLSIHIVNPRLDNTGEIGDLLNVVGGPVDSERAVYYNVDKRFLSFLPFLMGVDYSEDLPTDKNPTDAEPEFRRMFVLVKDPDGKYQYAEKLIVADEDDNIKQSGANVRPLAREMGFEMQFRPAYMAAKNHWINGKEGSAWDSETTYAAGNISTHNNVRYRCVQSHIDQEPPNETYWEIADEPGVFTDKITTEGIDYEKIIATVFIETDQHVQMSHKFGNYENQRIKTIDIPDAELWYVTPDTIIDVDDNGDCILYGGDENILRDDRDRLRAALTAAIAWYGKRRNKINITIRNIDPAIPIGYMIEGGDVAGVGAAATPVTSISWNFGRRPSTVISTDFGELDIAGIFGGRT